MLIAIDYDNTYTLDPDFWDSFLENARKSHHNVICVTRRFQSKGKKVYKALDGKVDDVIFCNHRPKIDVTRELGIYVDVWIDDSPEYIFIEGE